MSLRGLFRLTAAAAALTFLCLAASAQTAAPTAPAATKSKPESGGGGEGDLRRRVQQLEEQIVDMQVVIARQDLPVGIHSEVDVLEDLVLLHVRREPQEH